VPQIVISSDERQPGHGVRQDNLYVETFAPPFGDLQATSASDAALYGVHWSGGAGSTIVDGAGGAGGSHHVSTYFSGARILLLSAAWRWKLTFCGDVPFPVVPMTTHLPYIEFNYGNTLNIDTSLAAELHDISRQPFSRRSEHSPLLWPGTSVMPSASAPHGLRPIPQPGSHGAGTTTSRNVPVSHDAPPREQAEFSQVYEDFCEYFAWPRKAVSDHCVFSATQRRLVYSPAARIKHHSP
jgi:hypothetical protein